MKYITGRRDKEVSGTVRFVGCGQCILLLYETAKFAFKASIVSSIWVFEPEPR